MADRADAIIGQAVSTHYAGGGTNYLVQTPDGVMYKVYIDSLSDVVFRKSTDNGLTWQSPVVVFTGTTNNLSVWYDKWSGLAGGLILMAYTDTTAHDTFFRTINTASADALSTQTVIFAGASAVLAGSFLSITRARGGNVACRTQIDAGTEGVFSVLVNANVPNGAWAARTINEAAGTLDQMILMPGFAADSQDLIGIFWDISANQISRQLYDDSANSWAESILTGTFTENNPANGFPHFAAAVDLTNSQIVLLAWNAIDAVNADLTCWTITESANTAKTDVITNSTDDQGLCGITINDDGHWVATYAGLTGGGETYQTALNIYRKVSSDSGATWGPETLMTTFIQGIRGIYCIPIDYLHRAGTSPFAYFAQNTTLLEVKCNTTTLRPRLGHHLIG